jgi:hypothetical protein
MKVLIVLAVITGLLLAYALKGREWLKSKPWAQGFFAAVEPIEILFFKKSETILFARLKMLTGFLLMILSQVGTIDLTPIMPFVPEQYQGVLRVAFNLMPLIITAVGWMDERLRNGTTKPIELVAVPETGQTAEVKVAIAQAEDAKEQAVAIVKDKVI